MVVNNDPRYPTQLAELYLTWADVLRNSRTASVGDQQRILLRAFECEPTNWYLLRRLITGLRLKGVDREISRGVIQAALERQIRPDIVHILLAIESTELNFPDTAESYLLKAQSLNPNVPRILAEIARTYFDIAPADAELGAKLTDFGLKAWPQDPDLRFMRGYVALRSNRWFEAITHLNVALSARPKDPNVHRLLADAYRHIGRSAEAEEHNRQADRILAAAGAVADKNP